MEHSESTRGDSEVGQEKLGFGINWDGSGRKRKVFSSVIG